MAILQEYHRPETVSQALDLLADPRSRRLPLAGGTHLVPALETRQRRDVDGVVDLAGLDLSFIERDGHYLRSRRDDDDSQTWSNILSALLSLAGSLPRTARFEGPQNLCNAATVGGLIALAEPDSELFAALLALDAAIVSLTRDEVETVQSFEDYISGQSQPTCRADLITEMRLSLGAVRKRARAHRPHTHGSLHRRSHCN